LGLVAFLGVVFFFFFFVFLGFVTQIQILPA
jgi:hypothetical protein